MEPLRPSQAERYLAVARQLIAHIKERTTHQHPDGPRFVDAKEYRDTDVHKAELDIFRNVPSVFATKAEVPAAGDYAAKIIAGVRILVVRAKDDKVHVYLNACPHRGATLAEGSGNFPGKRIVCPYHAWSFNLDGGLLAIAEKSHFGDIDDACFDLIELPSEERHGLIFSLLDPAGAFDLDAHLGSFDAVLRDLDLAGFNRVIRQEQWDEPMNWKFAMSTYFEAYHFAILHPNTVGPAVHPDTTVLEEHGPHAVYYVAASALPSMAELDDDSLLASLGQGFSAHNAVHFLFPNTVITGFGPRPGSNIVSVYPGNEPGQQSTDFRYIGGPAVDADFAELQQGMADLTFFAGRMEDYELMTRADTNVASTIHPGVTFGANEALLTLSHRSWAKAAGRPAPDLPVSKRQPISA